jgi:acyl-CoA synthetase (AMP-forming)/AMP-acid ligase II
MPVHAFTVYDMIERGALCCGAQPAIIHGDTAITYAQFRRRVDALATGLAGHGIAKGERICILAQNDPAYLDLYGACARLGIVAYPINWRLTAGEVARVVERAAPRMLVADSSTLNLVADWPARMKHISFWYQFGPDPGEGFTPFARLYIDSGVVAAPDLVADDPFAVISTAAVDAIPRGAVLTHGNVLAANQSIAAQMRITAADRYLLALPLFHITALGNALATLHTGGANVLVSRYDADEAVRLVDRHQITHVSDFPPVLSTLLDAAEKAGSKLASLRIVSGLDAPATMQRLHAKTQAKFWTGFGQSETSGFVTLLPVQERPGTAGQPVPICRVKCVDDLDREVPTGTPGEIVVRGPLVFQGYFAQPDVTAHTLRNGWHHTGDVGKFDADGYLTYVKRKPEKELIKPGGENVYPAEVETVILQLAGVSGVCVYGIPDAQWGEAIKAVVEVQGKNAYSPQQVIDHVGGKIARFKRPKVVVFTDALPRGADREAVKAKWGNS